MTQGFLDLDLLSSESTAPEGFEADAGFCLAASSSSGVGSRRTRTKRRPSGDHAKSSTS